MKQISKRKFFSYLCLSVFICGQFFLFSTKINAQKEDDIIEIDTELVSFEVSVTDKDGKPIRGLNAEDFELFVDGQKRPIDFFKPIKKNDVNRPLSVVFALDVSGSITKQEIINLRNAMQKFVQRLADYNSYFAVMTFGMEVKIVQSFTNKPGKLRKTFNKILKDQDGLSTHAYDAVDDAVRLIRKKSPRSIKQQIPKRVVVVITDGYPVGDIVSPRTVIERANDAETSVYAVILPSYSTLSRLSGKKGKPVMTLLEASGLMELTGGSSFYARDKDFEPLFRALAEEITASYALAFYPDEQEGRDGKFRKVKIEGLKDLVIKQNRNGFQIKK